MSDRSIDSTNRPAARQRRPAHAQVVYDGVLFKVWSWDQQTADAHTVRFETLSRPDTALVLPLLADGRVVMAVESQPGGEPEVRALGGKVEPSESPEAAARRELREEAGLVAEVFHLWTAWQPMEKVDWALYIFIAESAAFLHEQELDVGEVVSLRHVDAADLVTPRGRRVIQDPELKYALSLAHESPKEEARLRRLLGLSS